MITVNISKAKEIVKDKIRAERAKLLAQLDVEFMRAVEMADTAKQQEIAAKKQALRDAPAHSSIEEAETTEELKQITIDSILGEQSE